MDYSTLVHPTGRCPIAVYDGTLNRVICQFDDGAWGIYNTFNKIWCSDNYDILMSTDRMREMGWGTFMTADPIWVVSGNKETIDAVCVCSIQSLMVCGCPSSRGKKCRSK